MQEEEQIEDPLDLEFLDEQPPHESEVREKYLAKILSQPQQFLVTTGELNKLSQHGKLVLKNRPVRGRALLFGETVHLVGEKKVLEAFITRTVPGKPDREDQATLTLEVAPRAALPATTVEENYCGGLSS